MKLGSVNSPILLYFSRLAILSHFLSPMNYRSDCQYLQKGSGNFERSCIKPVDHFVKYCPLNNIKCSNPWTWGVFHLFWSSLISFTYYFICFYTFVNGDVLLISFLNCSFLVPRKRIDFCILIMHPATLLSLLLLILFLWMS